MFKKRRDVVDHFFKIEYNFDFLVHSLMNSMLTSVLPLDFAIHLSLTFLMEGQKVLFRVIFGLLEMHRNYLIKTKDNKDFIENFRDHIKKSTKLSYLLKVSFEAKIATTGLRNNLVYKDADEADKQKSKTKSKVNNSLQMNKQKYSDDIYKIPPFVMNSKIVDFK